MTNIPEAFLAREAQIAYSSVCLITDYDCWMDDPSQHVSVDKFFEVYSDTLARAIRVLKPLVASPFTETPAHIRQALNTAVLTPRDQLTAAEQHWLEVLER
jgi:5'-methylthioadenosine phosphorylase